MGANPQSDTHGARSTLLRVSVDTKLRVVVRLLTTPHGAKTAVARRLAAECGRSLRAIFHWRENYRRLGPSGLARVRSDEGSPRLYNAADFDRVIAASVRLRRRPYIKIRQEWITLNLPGSYETFRFWVRRLQTFGYIEAPTARRGKIGA